MDASNKGIVFREKVVELGRRITDTIAVPRDYAAGGRVLRTRIWVDAPNGEEDEDEATKKSCDVDGDGEDEPVRVQQRPHTGLETPR